MNEEEAIIKAINETLDQFLPSIKYEGKHILAYKGDSMKTEAKSYLRHYISKAKKGKIAMTWREYAHMIRTAYENGLYDPDSMEDIEEWMDVDITDISSFPGHYADEDILLSKKEEIEDAGTY